MLSGENLLYSGSSLLQLIINVAIHKFSSKLRIKYRYSSDLLTDGCPTITVYSEQHEGLTAGHSAEFRYPIGQRPPFRKFDFNDKRFAMNVMAFPRRLCSVRVTKPCSLQ